MYVIRTPIRWKNLVKKTNYRHQGEEERIEVWKGAFGHHFNKRVTVSTLYALAQLHSVELQVPRWDYIGGSLLGKTLYLQPRLRGIVTCRSGGKTMA